MFLAGLLKGKNILVTGGVYRASGAAFTEPGALSDADSDGMRELTRVRYDEDRAGRSA